MLFAPLRCCHTRYIELRHCTAALLHSYAAVILRHITVLSSPPRFSDVPEAYAQSLCFTSFRFFTSRLPLFITPLISCHAAISSLLAPYRRLRRAMPFRHIYARLRARATPFSSPRQNIITPSLCFAVMRFFKEVCRAQLRAFCRGRACAPRGVTRDARLCKSDTTVRRMMLVDARRDIILILLSDRQRAVITACRLLPLIPRHDLDTPLMPLSAIITHALI